jgi:transposase
MQEDEGMIVIGADTHKRSHTIAAVAAPTGELRGEQTVPVDRRGFGALVRWARRLDDEGVWALEDCRHVSGSLERFLIERGERVLRIPTHLTAKARKRARQRGKSDLIDAVNLARAALQEGPGSFPAAHLDGPELDLRLLVDHRERLVRHRVEPEQHAALASA